MRHLNVEYYAGLLTAATYYGTSHQKPGSFQVITTKRIRNLTFGRVHIDFVYKKSLADLPTQQITVKTGYLTISSPEVTAMDLFLYPHKSGGINHTATVLSELVEALDPDRLIALAKGSTQHVWIQRLGYLLEHIDSLVPEHQQEIVNKLATYVSSQEYTYVALAPELPTKGSSRSKKWKIIENTTVESDI